MLYIILYMVIKNIIYRYIPLQKVKKVRQLKSKTVDRYCHTCRMIVSSLSLEILRGS